jgi:four helix bundle protein
MAETYRDLLVWQKSIQMVKQVYAATKSFPREEIYGLTSQMRRAAVSIPSNIAEGKGRFSKPDLLHFFTQARGSLLELETQIIIAQELDYLSRSAAKQLLSLTAEVGRMLNGFLRAFRTKPPEHMPPDA